MRGGVFNMGSERMNYTKREIAEKIKEICPCDVIEADVGDTDTRNFLVSFERAKALGFDCEKTLEDQSDLSRSTRLGSRFSTEVKPTIPGSTPSFAAKHGACVRS